MLHLKNQPTLLRSTPHTPRGVVVEQRIAAPAPPCSTSRWSSAAPYFPARETDNGDTPSKWLLQKNGCAGRRSRLKIQAGCRPARHTLADPKDVDLLWSANSQAGSVGGRWFQMGPAISAFIELLSEAEEANLRTELDGVVL